MEKTEEQLIQVGAFLESCGMQVMANVTIEGRLILTKNLPSVIVGCTFINPPMTVREAWRQLKGAVLDSVKSRLHWRAGR